MSLMTKQELELLGQYVVVRTPRGNEIIKRDPREMPRRLRVLLLAIDGGQPVNLYTQTLKGFGDVSELLIELLNLGVVRLVEPYLAQQQKAEGRSDSFAALDNMLDDSRFDSESAADVFYGATTPGSFDDIVRVARIERPEFRPASPAAQPVVAAPEQKVQIESLFNLLDAVRGERANLKQQIIKLQRVREAALRLHHQNLRQRDWIYALGITCFLLTVSLAWALLRH
jgi:hypothetical protein